MSSELAKAQAVIQRFIAGQQGLTILDRAVAATGLSKEQLRAKDQTHSAAKIRHYVYHAMRMGTDLSYPEIGRIMHRNHTTVIHGVEESENRCKRDKEYAGMVKALANVLKKPVAD